MGVKCHVCGKLDYSHPELSFHRSRLWDLLKNKRLLKSSDHFDPRHILTRENGKRFLDSAALPQIPTSVFVDTSSSSSILDEIPENGRGSSEDQQLNTSKKNVPSPSTDTDTYPEEQQKVKCMTAEAMENQENVPGPSGLQHVCSATEGAVEEEKEQS